MYGLINRCIEDWVIKNHGEDIWEDIKDDAEIDIEMFNRMQVYSDKITLKLVGAVCAQFNINSYDALKKVGEYFVRYTGQEGFGDLFDFGGKNAKSFLLNLNNMHDRIGKNFPKMIPPIFEFEDTGKNKLKLIYKSKREGFFPLVEGTFIGLEDKYQQKITITSTIEVSAKEHIFNLEFSELNWLNIYQRSFLMKFFRLD